MNDKTKDIIERSGKTFIQAFLGVLIPELIALYNAGLPSDIKAVWAYVAPVLVAALAAGISAVWNYAQHYLVPGDADAE